MKKNVASQLISAQMIAAADGSDQTTGTCNVAVEIDGAAGTGGTATHIANGKWEYAPIQGDTNGDYLTFQFVITGAITSMIQVYTSFPQTVDNDVLAAGATGFAAIDTVVDNILVDTAEIGTAGVGLSNIGTIATVTTLTNKTGFSLSTAGILAIWHQLTSAIVTASTIGKLLVDNIDAAISTAATATGFATSTKQDTMETTLNKVPLSDGSVSWNATALAAINAEADSAIVTYGLDHLVAAAVTGTDVVDDSIIASMVSKSATADWDTFDNVAESLEALEDHINNIASTGAAFHAGSTGSYTLTTGTQSSGTETSAEHRDGVAHEHTDTASGGVIDLYYEFDVGATGIAVEVEFTALVTGNNDSMDVYVYDWVGADWEVIHTIAGQASGTTYDTIIEALFGKHTGTGGNVGLVRIRFEQSGLTTPTLKVDQIFIAYATDVEAAVWSASQASYTTAGTFGEIATETAAILVDTAEIGTAGLGLTNLGASGNDWNTVVPDAAGVAPTAIENRQEMDSNSTVLATIATDTTTDIPALIADVPTVAEFNARTLVAASYFDPAADTVAQVTLVDTVTANTDLVSVADILTTQMTEAYAADGAAPTLAQALMMIQQMLGEFSISGTTLTMKKLDGATSAATFTLDDGTNPTSLTRAT